MIRLRLLLLSVFITCSFAQAQVKIISGSIRDAADKSPLTGVSILLKGTQKVTQSDKNGNFSIDPGSEKSPVLIFRYVGYTNQEIPAAGKTSLTIYLAETNKGLDEVVVVGYGTQKKATLTGSVGVVKSETIADRPITSASQALSGQVAGVWVNQVSGQPGADAATIRVRGIGTLGNSSALVVVDGVVASLNDVNPNDIESITVLKDASAAIYGSRAANGVILVQTKMGKKGATQIDFTSYIGTQKAITLPEVVTNSLDYMKLYNQALANQGGAAYFTQQTLDKYAAGTDPLIYPNNDWRSIIIKPATIQSNLLRLSGGKEGTQYAVSLGYNNQDGIVIKDNSKNYTLRTNIDSKVTNKFDWGLRTALRYQTQNQSYYNGGAGGMLREVNRMLREVNRTLPFYGTYTASGDYASTWVNAINPNFQNPLAMVNEGKNYTSYYGLNASLFLNYEILDGLKWNVTGGANYWSQDNQLFTPKIDVYDPLTLQKKSTMGAAGPTANNSWEKNLYKTIYTSLTYKKTIARDHDFTLAGIYSQEKNDYRNLGGSIMGFVSNSLSEINAGITTPLINGTSTAWALKSYIGRLNYAYKEKYLLEGIVRSDGSSRFAQDTRWGVFPSVSVGWRITQEDFMKSQHVVNELKLRGSWGKSGNDRSSSNDQEGLYSYIPTLAFARFYNFDNTMLSGVAQTSIVDTGIKWEVGTKKNIGFDASFLGNKLSTTFDYFVDKRTGILRSIKIPDFLGITSSPVQNLASVSNKGWEFSANYASSINDFKFSAGFNVTHVRNNVDYIPDPQIGFNSIVQGQPINEFYMWKAIGIFQNQNEVDNSPKPNIKTTKPGDLKFEDSSGPDGKPDGIIDQYDRQYVGKPIPTWTYGINLSAAYKGFDLSVMVQGVAMCSLM
ncbi:hypothetical protein TH53_20935 [Pedobacter lusitanus]|uniref:TonB-dependent receptor n=1 Tax=Pedobacter lusitanus TaxID=1503925 RepID=A0A0D0GDN8_9SPHI|nr:TonB-dependent receptor [Pedobacter lusitanus]KIO75437.1 hypothetical protein TH53_20935 [Pedobacter lusitanus]